jgi:hypothetical protein
MDVTEDTKLQLEAALINKSAALINERAAGKYF